LACLYLFTLGDWGHCACLTLSLPFASLEYLEADEQEPWAIRGARLLEAASPRANLLTPADH